MSDQIPNEYTYELAISPDGETRLAAQASGLKRFDGQQWLDALASLEAEESFAVTAVALSPAYDADGTIFAGAAGAILRSRDQGEAWEAFALPVPPPVITALVLAPDYADSGTVYAATLEDGVFVSRDRGAQWAAWNFGLIGFSVNALVAQAGGRVVAGTDLGIFRSQNAGRSWQDIALFETPVTALAVANDAILAGAEEAGLWRLHGDRREPVAPDRITGTVDRIFSENANLLLLCDNDLLLSRDQGSTWHSIAGDRVVTAVAAPHGLAGGATVLVAGEDGTIQPIILA